MTNAPESLVAFGPHQQLPAADLTKPSLDASSKAAATSNAEASSKGVHKTADQQHHSVRPNLSDQAEAHLQMSRQPAGSNGLAQQQAGHLLHADSTAGPLQPRPVAGLDAQLVQRLQDKLGRSASKQQAEQGQKARQAQLPQQGQKRKSQGPAGQQALAETQQGTAVVSAAAAEASQQGATDPVEISQKAKRRKHALQAEAVNGAQPAVGALDVAEAPPAQSIGTNQKAKRKKKVKHGVAAEDDEADLPCAEAAAAQATGLGPEVAAASSSQRRAAGPIMYSSPHQV